MDDSFVKSLDDQKLRGYFVVLQRMLEQAAEEIEWRGTKSEPLDNDD